MADAARQLEERLHEVRERMAQAAQAAGRKPDEVLLCAACKSQPRELILASAALDIDCFGENRMQEMLPNLESGVYLDKPCHFIGHLQRNKVRRVVGAASMIQSVNSLRLLQAIHAEALRQGIRQDILLEINIDQEESKTGADEAQLWPLMEACAELPQVRLRGLMSMPWLQEEDGRAAFARMRLLYERARPLAPEPAHFDTLSMGMTDSYEAAILEGATLVRVGSGIYGPRQT